MGNLGGAAQIATVMLTFVMVLLSMEIIGRRKQRFYQSSTRYERKPKEQLQGKIRWVAFLLCAAPVFFGFIIPLSLLIQYSLKYFSVAWNLEFRQFVFNSFYVSVVSALSCVVLAIIISYTKRMYRDNNLIATLLASRL